MSASTTPEPSDNRDEPNPVEVSIVLPAHNEVHLLGSSVAKIVTALEARAKQFEIIVVENGSTDGTLRLARVLASQLPQVRFLTLPRANYGAALRAGFEAAQGIVLVSFDVDYYDFGFYDAASLLLDGGDDLVLASKRAEGARDERPVLRRLLTAGFSLALHSMVELEATDAHGMKVMNRAAIAPVVEQCEMTGSLFDVELVLRALRSGLRVAEIPSVVVELRPPRTSVLRRSIETGTGLVRLRIAVGRKAPDRKVYPLSRPPAL